MGDATYCEYGRCGGLGRREVKRKRLARLVVTVDGKLWRVWSSRSNGTISNELPPSWTHAKNYVGV